MRFSYVAPGPDLLHAVDRVRFAEWLPAYEKSFEKLRKAHPVYRAGWGFSLMHPHRYMNLLMTRVLRHFPGPVVDFGCYDGALVKALRTVGRDAFGVDKISWPEMWEALSIEQFVNGRSPTGATVTALNVAHNYAPEQFLPTLDERLGFKVRTAIVDREARTPAEHNAAWMDDEYMQARGWRVYRFAEYEVTQLPDYQRSLLIWEAPRA